MTNHLLKKATAVLLTAAMAVSFTACGSKGAFNDSSSDIVIYPETTDAEPLTIGYTFWDLDFDGFMNDQANQIKLVADALNVKLVFNPNTDDFSADSVARATQSFADQGVDGIIAINFSENSLLDISSICQEGQIPFIQATRTINDAEVAAVVEKNPYYIGRIHESEYAAAYEVGRKIIEKGAKKIILLSPEHNDVSYEARAEGFRDACEEPDVEIVEEVWELGDDEATKNATKDLLARHPDADGIFAVRGGFFPYIISAEEEIGLDKYLLMGGIDFDKSLGKHIESGAITAVAGGHHADAALSLITLVNAIRGSYDASTYPIDINYNMMVIDSVDAFNEYREWCLGYDEDYDNRQILNANDARGLCVDYNPNATLHDITVMAENMSIQNVIDRHKSFLEKK